MIRIALFGMLSILKARNSAMFCHTGTAYPKIGRTIVTNTLARETGEAPTLLENCERVKPLVFAFLIL